MNELFNLPPFYLMAKPIGASCNLRCSYCYYLEKEKLYEQRNKCMSDVTLEKYIKTFIESSFDTNVLFSWHGGETLIAGLDFFRKAIKLQKQYGVGKNISNTIQTNGILLTDEWCKFFSENNFLVGISIDGPQHVHDKYRKTTTGEGSYSEVKRGIDLLKKYNVEFNTMSVINDYSSQFPLEIYNHLKELGSQYIQFAPIVERVGKRDDSLQILSANDNIEESNIAQWSVKPIDFGKFYTAIFRHWYKNDIGKVFVQFFDTVVSLKLDMPSPICTQAVNCGNAMIMESNGDVYSCDHYVFPENKLGNIYTTPLADMAYSPKQREFGATKKNTLSENCKKCPYLKMCNGGCPKNRIYKDENGVPINYLCEGIRYFFDNTTNEINNIASQIKEQQR